jgi:hypothetical protein
LHINQIIVEFGLTISVQKTKSVSFKGRNPIRSKNLINNKTIEQVNSFNFLGNLISYENEMDTDNKLKNSLKKTGIINNVFRPKKTLKKTKIKLYNTLALPTLLYGSENWTNKARNATNITAAEMKYMRRKTGYIWTDHKKYRDYKGIKHNPSFGHNTGLQEKMGKMCKSNAT